MNEEKAIIQTRLKLLDEYMRELRELQHAEFEEYVANYMIHKTVERVMETAIQACLDMGRHIIAHAGFRYPEENRQVFRVLAEEKVIPQELLGRLEEMAGFRNVLVHDYADIEHAKVYRNLQDRLGDFEEFAAAIFGYLNRPAEEDQKNKTTRERRARYVTRNPKRNSNR